MTHRLYLAMFAASVALVAPAVYYAALEARRWWTVHRIRQKELRRGGYL